MAKKPFEEILGTIDVEARVPSGAGARVKRKPPTRAERRAGFPSNPGKTATLKRKLARHKDRVKKPGALAAHIRRKQKRGNPGGVLGLIFGEGA